MRIQRRAAQTVQLVSVTSTRDDLGNISTTPVTTTVEGAQFEPSRPAERTGNDEAPVFLPAVWNLPGVRDIDADDQIVHGGDTWYVIGGGQPWLDRTKVPVQTTRPV